MKIRLFGVVEAEGNPEDLSMFASLFFSGLKQVAEMQAEQEQNSAVSELMKSIDEAMKHGKQNRG
jgi:hypothetical protein